MFYGLRGHRISFRGKSNDTKGRAFLVLFHRRYILYKNTGLTCRQLSEQSGCLLCTIESRIVYWTRWHYILKRKTEPYRYVLAARGRYFVNERMPENVKRRLLAEIRETRTAKPG